MTDPAVLVSADGSSVSAAASLFPMSMMLDSAGASPTRFILGLLPGTGTGPENPAQWVACVWQNDQLGGDPILLVCEAVDKVLVFSAATVELLLTTGQRLIMTASGGCACGSRLRGWQPWGQAVNLHGVPRPVV
jgi:hypothetical protein